VRRQPAQHPPARGDTAGQPTATNDALLANGCGPHGEGFATALLGRLDLRTGELDLVNAGHAAPYLARQGRVRLLDLPADLPLGTFDSSTYRSTTVPLRAGERVVIVTDGMLERAAASVDLGVHVQRTSELHPREATQELADLVVEASGGVLADDAALLILDCTVITGFFGAPWRERTSGHPRRGADRATHCIEGDLRLPAVGLTAWPADR
jgi:hypothetical protein